MDKTPETVVPSQNSSDLCLIIENGSSRALVLLRFNDCNSTTRGQTLVLKLQKLLSLPSISRARLLLSLSLMSFCSIASSSPYVSPGSSSSHFAVGGRWTRWRWLSRGRRNGRGRRSWWLGRRELFDDHRYGRPRRRSSARCSRILFLLVQQAQARWVFHSVIRRETDMRCSVLKHVCFDVCQTILKLCRSMGFFFFFHFLFSWSKNWQFSMVRHWPSSLSFCYLVKVCPSVFSKDK